MTIRMLANFFDISEKKFIIIRNLKLTLLEKAIVVTFPRQIFHTHTMVFSFRSPYIEISLIVWVLVPTLAIIILHMGKHFLQTGLQLIYQLRPATRRLFSLTSQMMAEDEVSSSTNTVPHVYQIVSSSFTIFFRISRSSVF